MAPFTATDFEPALRKRLVKEADRLLARDIGRGAKGEREMYIRFAIESRDEGCLPELEAA